VEQIALKTFCLLKHLISITLLFLSHGSFAHCVDSASEHFTGFSIAIPVEIGVPLPQQHLGLGIGTDLLAGVAPA